MAVEEFHSDSFKNALLTIADEPTVMGMLKIHEDYMFEIGAMHEQPPTEETPAACYVMSEVERRFVTKLKVSPEVAHKFHAFFIAHMNAMQERHNRRNALN